MIGHQRDIMATLGIDIWIPRATVCQHNQPALWRDVTPEEDISEIILSKPPVALEPVVASLKIEPELKAKINLEETTPVVETVVAQPAVNSELVPELQISAFSIEAVRLAHCVLVVDTTTITADQQQLWKSIQRAVQSEFNSLQWPFAWQNMQDGRGAESYVSGFIDAMSAEKNILCLGQIPYLTSSKSIQLASLQEMLEQPLLKKRLWQFMQNKTKE